MPRPNKPWFHESKQVWCCKIRGKLYVLARGKSVAKRDVNREFHKLMVSLGRAETPSGDISLVAMMDLFMDSVADRCAPLTYEFYRRHLKSFERFVGRGRLASSITAEDIEKWLAQGWHKRLPDSKREWRPYGQSTRHGAITAVKAAFSWAAGREPPLIARDPLAKLKGPGIKQRKGVLDEPAIRRILGASRGPFRDLIEFMWETGCRPSEATDLEARHVEFADGVVRMQSKTSRKTGEDRIIYLTEVAAAILRRNADRNPAGAVFRNSRGNPWHRHAMAAQFGRLRKKFGLGDDGTAEAIRHAFGTDGALRLKPMVLAEVMGHTSTAMIDRYYVHLDRRQAEMLEAVKTVRGARPSEVPERPPVRPAHGPGPVGRGVGTDGGSNQSGLDVGTEV